MKLNKMVFDDKKIEEAARRNADKYRNYPTLSDEDRDKVSIGSFMDCAKWMQEEFLKDLWHPASEEPIEFAEVLAEAKITESINTYLSFKRNDALFKNWAAYSLGANITRWLYIDDLFQKEGGNHD